MIRKLFLCVFITLLTSSFMFAQRTVSGTVSDDTGPLPAASVVVKGTTNGTTTDFDGNYSITVPDDQAVLVFSFLGYVSKEITVGGQTTINVTLEEDSESLDEVVVTALGFTVDKKSLGATYSKVDAAAARQSGETGVINALAGKASGVKISRANGDPGAGSSIQIRGANTITGNTQPLIVVDGIPFSNENANGIGNTATGGVSQQSRLNDINQDDIESMTVLKGASAAAVWGSQAANGVIVITTKKGRNTEKVNVSYGVTLSVDEISEKHPLQTTFGQGRSGRYQYDNSRSWGDKIADRAGGEDINITAPGQYFSNSSLTTDRYNGYFETANGNLYYRIPNGLYYAADGTRLDEHGGKRSREVFTDSNFDQIFGTGTSVNHNVSVSGGGDKGTYYFSFAKLDNDGIVNESFYDKINASLNTTYKFNDWLTARAKFNYIKTKANRIQQSSNSNGLYLGLLRNAPDFDITDYIGTYYNRSGTPTPLRQRAYRDNNGQKANSGYNNPLWTIFEQENLNNVNRYVANIELTIKPVEWFTLIARGGIDNYNDFRSNWFPMFSSSSRSDGEYAEEKRDLKNLTFDLIGRANYQINDDLGSSYTLGYGHNNKDRHSVWTRATDFILNSRLRDFETLTTDEFTRVRNSKSFFKSDRIFGVASFDYKNTLYINLSGAYETFSSASEGTFYPAIDASWNFINSEAFQDSFLSSGKLRASFGQVGVAPQRHKFDTTYEGFSYSDFDDPLNITFFGGGFRLNDDEGNPNLKPEIKTEFEIGTDLKFFNNRIGLNITYYSNEIDDVLFDVDKSPSTGFNNLYKNAGKLENKGIEIDWDVDVLKHDDYTVSLYGNFNNNESKVLELEGTTTVSLVGGSISSNAVVGYPVGVLFGSTMLRNEDGSLNLNEFGFPQIGPDDVIGDPNPDWRGGLGLKANYKNFNFNILFETSQGNDYAERTRFILSNFGTHADVGNEVTLTQDLRNIRGDVFTAGSTVRGNIRDFGGGPVLLDERYYTTIHGFGDSVINELAIGDGSWTRLREITIGYTFNSEKFQKKTGLSSINFGLTGRNLALWTDVVGVDPEINQSGVANGFGIDYFTNPTTKSYVFTLKINY